MFVSILPANTQKGSSTDTAASRGASPHTAVRAVVIVHERVQQIRRNHLFIFFTAGDRRQ